MKVSFPPRVVWYEFVGGGEGGSLFFTFISFSSLLFPFSRRGCEKKVKKKVKKLPLSLKALGAAANFARDPTLKYEKKLDKDSSIMLKGNPKKKSIGLWFKKSF